MKRLVYSNENAIKTQEQTANQLIESLNTVLDRFKASHNHFSQPIDEAFAFGLVSDPVGTFDGLLRANSPIKPIGGKQLDIEKLAELTGIDRAGFIDAFTVVLPGSVDNYNKKGQTGLLVLTEKNKPFVRWQNDKFALNDANLKEICDRYKVYAENPQQVEVLNYWESLKDNLNTHVEKKFIQEFDIQVIADRVGLVVQSETITPGNYKKRFAIDYKKLADSLLSVN